MVRNSDHADMELVALVALAETSVPVGALRLAEAFRDAGIAVSEATAGRFLYQLDQRGMTEAVGTRGRILTDAGREQLAKLQLRQQRDAHSAQVAEAVNATATQDLIDLLHVRRAIEAEAARLAAIRASDTDIAALAMAAKTHVQFVGEGGDRLEASMDFHLLVAQAAHNRLLFAVVSLLLEPANDPLESLLDHIATNAGVVLATALDHREVVEAIQRRDPHAAERVMRQHLDTLIQLATEFHGQVPLTHAQG